MTRDADRKREKRKSERLVIIPKCADIARRRALEQDDEEWLYYYFHPDACPRNPFTYRFVKQQRRIIETVGQAIRDGRDKSIAASRGEGKTTICERLAMKYIMQGNAFPDIAIYFAVLLAATGGAASNSLDEMKDQIESNERLCLDYPEICVPVRALESTPQKAHTQIVSGYRHDTGEPFDEANSKFTWCGDEVIMPNVPGSPSALSIIATRGLDAAILGLKKKGRRPDLILIDDPDTLETARSQHLADKLESNIEGALGQLGGQTRRAARVMITTVRSRISASYKYTDRKLKPYFRGERFAFLEQKPTNLDRWEEYVMLAQQDQLDETTKAHDLYLAHFDEMNAGARVANANRFTKTEATALEYYYAEMARMGEQFVLTELDNNPAEETGFIESGISKHRIQKQISGYARKLIPPGFTVLTHTIDVRKIALHWVVRAWRLDGTGTTIDYGIHSLIGTERGKEEGVEAAVYNAIIGRMIEFDETDYTIAGTDGEMIPRSKTISLVDAGWQTQVVYQACRDARRRTRQAVLPIMGLGKSCGCVRTSYRELYKSSDRVKNYDGYRFVKREGGLWLVESNADYWKAWEHDRWMTGDGRVGQMTLYGEHDDYLASIGQLTVDQKKHFNYATHIVNEREVEKPYRGGMRRE